MILRFEILFIALAFLSGCSQIIDYEIPIEPPVPVVNAFINPDSLFAINVTGSRHVLDDNYDFKPLTGFQVQVYQNERLLGETWGDEEGNYVLEDFYPEYGQSYRIELNKEGVPAVSARDIIPSSSPEFSILSHKLKEEDYSIFHIFELEIDNPEDPTFFEITAFAYQYFYDWQPTGPPILMDSAYLAFPVFTDNPIADNAADFYGRQSILFSNTLINTPTFKIDINMGYVPFRNQYDNDFDSAQVDIIVRGVSENYYYYLNSFRLQQESQGDPLAEPVMVYTNIKNGLGIFSSYVQSKQSYLVSPR